MLVLRILQIMELIILEVAVVAAVPLELMVVVELEDLV
tara:strand:+ start:356 stop:469 length:114 start_codon:yes stop_codon:yes gene_type:complete